MSIGWFAQTHSKTARLLIWPSTAENVRVGSTAEFADNGVKTYQPREKASSKNSVLYRMSAWETPNWWKPTKSGDSGPAGLGGTPSKKSSFVWVSGTNICRFETPWGNRIHCSPTERGGKGMPL